MKLTLVKATRIEIYVAEQNGVKSQSLIAICIRHLIYKMHIDIDAFCIIDAF